MKLPWECWALIIIWFAIVIPLSIWIYRDWKQRHKRWEDRLPDLVALDREPGSPEHLQHLLREALPMLLREADRAEVEAKAGANTADAEVLDFYSNMCADVVHRVRHALGLPANHKRSIK